LVNIFLLVDDFRFQGWVASLMMILSTCEFQLRAGSSIHFHTLIGEAPPLQAVTMPFACCKSLHTLTLMPTTRKNEGANIWATRLALSGSAENPQPIQIRMACRYSFNGHSNARIRLSAWVSRCGSYRFALESERPPDKNEPQMDPVADHRRGIMGSLLRGTHHVFS
jgi:hypothetical protein